MKSPPKNPPELLVAQNGSDYEILDISAIEQWLEESIKAENSSRGTITLVLCSDDTLLEINRQYLNHNTLTDIITFDYSENGVISGDLFISIDRIKENAATHSVDFNDELHRVIIHGVLHLCGYKDKNPEDQRQMRSKEDYYLSSRTF